MNPIETKRLQIRRFTTDDWRAVHTYTSMPDMMEYMEEEVMIEADTQEFVQKQTTDEVTAYALILKTEEQLIGHMIYHPWYAPRTFEIGWIVHPGYHRQGYSTEAAYALLRHGFEEQKLHRIIATCQPENVASYRVMEKLGMRREGHFQKCIYRGNNAWWSEYFYAILAEEWREKVRLCN
ncbi:MAG: GNAT family protein [Chloroflexota bacterium]